MPPAKPAAWVKLPSADRAKIGGSPRSGARRQFLRCPLTRHGREEDSMAEEAMESAPSSRGKTLMERGPRREQLDVVVVGAGQAGLSAGYYLAQMGVRFAILDGADRIGDVWRKRWDSLRLFTPARFDGLAGMPFPA